MSRFASNKTKLAACLGISRTLLYAYFRLPDAPAPCADGRWNVPRMRKFIASHAAKVEAPNEAEALRIRKLTLQCEREQYELNEARAETRNEITGELINGFVSIAQMIRSGLYQMRNELAPAFASGFDARGIYRSWEDRERQLFAAVCAELEKRAGAQIDEPDTRAENVVVSFKPSTNGNGVNGHRRAAIR